MVILSFFNNVSDIVAVCICVFDKSSCVLLEGNGCIRIACTVDEARLTEAMDRLERYLTERGEA